MQLSNLYWLSILCVLLGTKVSVLAQPYFLPGEDPRPKDQHWVPVEQLSDDFEGKKLDSSKWSADPTANGWGWIGRAPGLFREENVQLKKGNMRVTVGVLDQPEEHKGKTYTYQGAIVRAVNPGQVGWYYECKMKANQTAMSSTFWLMSRYDCERKLELDIQECVGQTSEHTAKWAQNWDQIYHSNAIHRTTPCVPEKLQLQQSIPTDTKNHERYYVYAAWWKSPEEIQFFLDGKYIYSIHPKVKWDQPAFLHMAIETYDWNPVPPDGGLVASGSKKQRSTQYEWVRTWQLIDNPQ